VPSFVGVMLETPGLRGYTIFMCGVSFNCVYKLNGTLHIPSFGNTFSIFFYFLPFTIEIIHIFYIKISQNFTRNLLANTLIGDLFNEI